MQAGKRLRSATPAKLCPTVLCNIGSVVDPGANYQGKLFLVLLLAFLVSIVIASVVAWFTEKRMSGRPLWQVIVCAAGLPMLAVAGILFCLGLVHSVRNQAAFGQPEAFPAVRSLIPVVLIAVLSYVIIQLRSPRRRRLASAAIWFVVAAVATRAWVLRVSFVDPWSAGLLWNWDEAALERRLPFVILLPLAGAMLGLLVRLGERRKPLGFLPALAYISAVVLCVYPVQYPATWAKADIGPLLGAYVNPAGDLIVNAYPAPQRALGTGFSAMLVRPHGRDGFRAIMRLPVVASGWYVPRFSPDFGQAELRSAVPLIGRLGGAYCRRSLVETSTNEVRESSTITLQGGFDWGVRTLGPVRSWFTIDDNSDYRTKTIRGVSTCGVPFVWIQGHGSWQDDRSWFAGASFLSIGHVLQRSSGRFLTELRVVNLESGRVSVEPFGVGDIGHIVGVSPDGRRFVAEDVAYHTKGHPWCITYRLYDILGGARVLGPSCSDESLVPVWLENTDPLLLPECDVTTAMREATLQEDRRLQAFGSDAREMGGRIFIEQGSRYSREKVALLELTRDGKHARAIAAGPVSVQWLSDSIVWCEQTSNGGRVVRFYPSDDRYEVLLMVP